MTYYTYAESPLGVILLTSDGLSLTGLYLGAHESGPIVRDDWEENDRAAPLPEARRQITAYFAGEILEFDLPMNLHGTPFQQTVWNELTRIPFGTTISYGELARRVGNPNASRAVGLANGQNPISVIVPCHRVIGANGKLVGYGGGLPRKEALLKFEASVLSHGPRKLEAIRDNRLFELV
jgi:methylated-DNA-[protein]-cysteine S-methyltransferase